jgi:Na+/proline symporter
LTAVFANAPHGFFRLTNPDYSWAYIGSNVFLFCLAFSSINWSLIQRYYCVPKESDAKKVGWLVFVLNVLGPPVILLPVMAARQFLTGVEESGQVYPLLCTHLLPAGMLGLVIAAMFSATMSMLSSDYNVCAGVLTNDVYRRYIRPQAGQKELVLCGRLATLVIGVVSLGVAFLMAEVGGEGLFRNMVKLFSIATAPVALPMMAGLLSRRVTNTAALTGFLAGVLTGMAIFELCPDSFAFLGAAWKKENAIVWGTTFATLLAMIGVSRLDPPEPAEQQRIDSFLDRLSVPIGRAVEDRAVGLAGDSRRVSPFRVVGVSTLAIGAMMLIVSPWAKDPVAFKTDVGVGIALALAGTLMVVRSAWKRTPAPSTRNRE